MKKAIALLMALIVLFTFAACGEDTANDNGTTGKEETTGNMDTTGVEETTGDDTTDTVTVFIPARTTFLSADGTQLGPFDMVFEEGWENKDSFEVQFSAEVDGNSLSYTITYGDRDSVTTYPGDTSNLQRTEVCFDENGQMISQVSYPTDTTSYDRIETIMTYDEKGRILTYETAVYYIGAEDGTVTTQSYTYTDTEQGSVGTDTVGGVSYNIRTYDQENRLVRVAAVLNGEEVSRTEYVYDENGCQTATMSYYMDQLINAIETTYKAVQISEEKAQQVPQFVREE